MRRFPGARPALVAVALVLLGGLVGWALRKATTDDALPPPPTTAREVAPSKPRPSRAHAEPVAAPAPSPSPVELSPVKPAVLGEIVGRVLLLPQRTPVAGATVELWTGSTVAVSPCGRTVRTGRDGVFRFPGCAPAYYRADANVEGLGCRSAAGRVSSGAGADLGDLVFGTGGAVEGHVVGPDGPAGGASAYACLGGIGGKRTKTVVDAEGNYRFGDLDPGKYVMGLDLDTPRTRYGLTVVVEEGKTVRCDFGAPASLAGRVTLDGVAVKAGQVALDRPDGISVSREFKDGVYRLDGLDPGDANVHVTIDGDHSLVAPRERVHVVVGENEFDFYVRRADLVALPSASVFYAGLSGGSAQVHGRVVAKATGQPLASSDFQLGVYAIDKNGNAAGARLGSLRFGSDGRFTISNLQAGRRRLIAAPSIGGLRERRMDVYAGGKTPEVEVALEPMATGKVAFHVKDGDGVPLTNVMFSDWTNVVVKPGVPISPPSWGGISPSGTFERHLEIGPHDIRVSTCQTAPGGKVTIDREAQATIEVVEGKTTDVDIVLRPKQ